MLALVVQLEVIKQSYATQEAKKGKPLPMDENGKDYRRHKQCPQSRKLRRLDKMRAEKQQQQQEEEGGGEGGEGKGVASREASPLPHKSEAKAEAESKEKE
jgi:hypothetical protein